MKAEILSLINSAALIDEYEPPRKKRTKVRRSMEVIDHPKRKNGRCSGCGFRIRSKKHGDGIHHQTKKRK